MGNEQRRHQRVNAPMSVEIGFPDSDAEPVILHTADISDGGAFIKADAGQIPAIGTRITLQARGLLGDAAPIVGARIVRICEGGFGVEFT